MTTFEFDEVQPVPAAQLGVSPIGVFPEDERELKDTFSFEEVVTPEQHVETPLKGVPNKDLPERFTDRYVWAVKNRKMPDVQDRAKTPSDLLRHAAELMDGVKQDFVQTLDEIVPFSPVGAMEQSDYNAALKRVQMDLGREQANIDRREATQSDYLMVAGIGRSEEQKEGQAFWGKTGQTLRGIVKFGGEFGATSLVGAPAGKAAHAATFKGLTRVGARGTLKQLTARAVGSATASVVRGVPTTMAVEGYLQKRAEGKTPSQAAYDAILRSSIAAGTEMLGGPLMSALGSNKFGSSLREFTKRQWISKSPGRTASAAQAIAKQVGYSGMLGELLEERVGELATYGAGLDEKLGGVSGAISEGRYMDAMQQMLTEFTAFAIYGAAIKTTGLAADGYAFLRQRQVDLLDPNVAPPGAPTEDPEAPPVAPGSPEDVLGTPEAPVAPEAVPGAPVAPEAPLATPEAAPGTPAAPEVTPEAPGTPGVTPEAPVAPTPPAAAPGTASDPADAPVIGTDPIPPVSPGPTLTGLKFKVTDENRPDVEDVIKRHILGVENSGNIVNFFESPEQMERVFGARGINRRERGRFLDAIEQEHFPELRIQLYNQKANEAATLKSQYEFDHNYVTIVRNPREKGFRTKKNQDRLAIMNGDVNYQKILKIHRHWALRRDRAESKRDKSVVRDKMQQKISDGVFDYESMSHATASQIPAPIKAMIQEYAEGILQSSNKIYDRYSARSQSMLNAIRKWEDDEFTRNARAELWSHFLGAYDPAVNLNTPDPVSTNQAAVWFAATRDRKIEMLNEVADEFVKNRAPNEFAQHLVVMGRALLGDPTVNASHLPGLMQGLASGMKLDWTVPESMRSALEEYHDWSSDAQSDEDFSRATMGKTTDHEGDEIERNEVELAAAGNVMASRNISIANQVMSMLTPVVPPIRGLYPNSPLSPLGNPSYAPRPTSPIKNQADTMQLDSSSGGKVLTRIHEMTGLLEDFSSAVGGRLIILIGRKNKLKKGALGLYWPYFDYARIRAANDLPVMIHEAGHAIDQALHHGFTANDIARMETERRLHGHPITFWQKKLPQNIQKELMALVGPGYENHPSVLTREGFAEWFRKWILEPQRAKTEAPLFTAWAEANLFKGNGDVLKKRLDKLRSKGLGYNTQGAIGRGKAQMALSKTYFQKWKEKIEGLSFGRFAEEWTDSFISMKKWMAVAQRNASKPIPAALNPYEIARALQGTAPSRVYRMVHHGMIDIRGRVVAGRALREINKYIGPENYEDFVLYLYAKRCWALAQSTIELVDPKTGQKTIRTQVPRNGGLLLTDVDYIISTLSRDNPGFEAASEIVYEWNQGVRDYVASSSPSMAILMEKISTNDPGYYVALQREHREIDRKVMEAYSGSAPLTSAGLIKRLKGSGEVVKDPLAQMIMQAESMVEAAHKAKIRDALFKLVKRPGMGQMMHEVDKDVAVAFSTEAENVLKKIKKNLTGVPARGSSTTAADAANIFESFLTDLANQGVDIGVEVNDIVNFFAFKKRPDGPDNVYPFMRPDGSVAWMWVDPSLYRALTIDPVLPTHLHGWFGKVAKLANKAKNVAVFGTTGLRPQFNLWNNPIRDTTMFFLNTSAGTDDPGGVFARLGNGSITALHAWQTGMLEAFNAKILNQALRTAGQPEIDTPWFDLASNLGLERASNIYASEVSDQTKQAVALLFHRPLKTLVFSPTSWPSAIGRLALNAAEIAQFSEMGVRLAELKIVADRIGVVPGQPLTFSQSIELMNAFKQINIDHSNGGHSATMVNMYVMFFRSAIGGWTASIESAKRDPYLYFARGLSLSALSVLYWFLVKDEEWYREAGDYKHGKWILPVGDWKNGNAIAIQLPKPLDMGAIFTSFPEAMLDSVYQRDREIAVNYAIDFLENHVPLFFSKSALQSKEPLLGMMLSPIYDLPVAGPLLEAYQNRSEYTGRPIVPHALQDAPVGQQFTQYTSSIARVAGPILGIAPAKLDHIVEGILGPASRDAMRTIDWMSQSTDAAHAGDSEYELTDTPVIGPLLFGAMFRRGGPMGTSPESVRQVYETLNDLHVRDRFGEEPEDRRQARLQMEDARKAITALNGLKDYARTVIEKRLLTLEQVKVAKAALEAHRAGQVAREQFRDQRKVLEAQLKQSRTQIEELK